MPQRKKSIENLKGNHGKDRLDAINPAYPDMPATPPDYLHPYARDVYAEFYPLMTQSGALKATDVPVFVAFCTQAGMVRESQEQLKAGLYLKDAQGKLTVNPAAKEFRLHTTNLLKIAIELGLSPKARSGVTITPTDSMQANDKLARLLEMNAE